MPSEVTLTRTPEAKQVYARALFDLGFTIREVTRKAGISNDTAMAIKRRCDYNSDSLEQLKKILPNKFYGLANESLNHLSPEKLEKCSAPQLMMVTGIAIDKARDMEGSNRPQFNIVTVVNECRQTSERLAKEIGTLDTLLVDRQASLTSTDCGQNAI